ncbi:hypothetical protein S40293_03597 [Stachybotrys chartarum IBT 40293]|nr:hypothetical protein S40293_03597 [Stachybotrys chartarum IBT 40293]
MSARVALVLGAGSNIGASIVKAFAAKNYKVATVSRSNKGDAASLSNLQIQSDFSDPESIAKVFTQVESELGVPDVVIYNAAAANAQDASNIFGLPVTDFARSLNVNTVSLYAAAQAAVSAWAKLPESASPTFIYTGNILNVSPIPTLLDLGSGKSASAHIIRSAAQIYKDKSFKFYYADERTASGGPVYSNINGPAHADLYEHAALMEENLGTPDLSDAVAGDQVIVKACDSCRKKKIRCNPVENTCEQCIKRRIPCHFTPICMKKTRRKPPGFRQIQELQDKLAQMEGLLEQALANQSSNEPDSSRNGQTMVGIRNAQVGESTQGVRGGWGRTGANRPTWVSDQDSELQHLVMVDEALRTPPHPVPSWKGGLALGPFARASYLPLPNKSTALGLVTDCFMSYNRFFPLFDEDDFMQQFHEQYSTSSPGSPAWWACINVVMCLAHRFRAMRTLNTAPENAMACGYLSNALAVVSELNMLVDSLPAVQALVGMAVILQGTPDPRASSVLVAAAVRLAQSMGLHRATKDPTLKPMQMEQRRRVFWIAYFLDRDISLRMGQPFAQDDEDMDVELPEDSLCGISRDQGLCSVNFFNSRIGLAVIQGQVYKKLYSVHASRQPETQKGIIAQELSSVLAYWKSSVPIDFEEYMMVQRQSALSVETVHLLIMRVTYVNCLIMIDRYLPSTVNIIEHAGMGSQVAPGAQESLCITESRKAMRLIDITPIGDYACVWMLLHPCFSAATLLLANIIQHPISPQAQLDLSIVEPFLHLLEFLAGRHGECTQSTEAKRMHGVCRDLECQAREAMARTGLSLIWA